MCAWLLYVDSCFEEFCLPTAAHPLILGELISALHKMLQVCRFCLCQDEALLIPLEDMLDFAACVQDVATLSGIQITEDNIASYYMCLECTTKLKSCISFRKTCLSNDAKFHELCGELTRTQECGGLSTEEDDAKEVSGAVEKTIEISDESSDFDISDLDSILGDSKTEDPKPLDREAESPTIEFVCTNDSKPTNWENPCKCQTCLWENILMPGWDDDGPGAFSYSANYIPLAEILYTGPAVRRIDWESLNPPAPPPVPYVRKRQRRIIHLCDRCGQRVGHIKSHMPAHFQNYTYNCPHCSTKTKTKRSLTEHINTVHMKIARNKCNICGRKFIHHKTYRYHMLSHEGKTFQCSDCSKTFSNAEYLRDHINRLHNAGKLVKKKSTEEQRNRRTRHRSKAIIEYEEINSQEDSCATNATHE